MAAEVALGASESSGGVVGALLLCAALALWRDGARSTPAQRARALFWGAGTAGPRLWGGSSGVVAQGAGGMVRGVSWARSRPTDRRPGAPGRSLTPGMLLPSLALAAAGALGVWQWSVLPLLGGVAAAAAIRRQLTRAQRRREAERRADAVVELCVGVSAELRAGRQPHEALLAAGVGDLGPPGTGVLAATRFGGDLPSAFRRASREAGGEGLGGVAACWQVAAEGGAGLAAGLDRVAHALRVERDQREDLHAQLAGPRATVAVLAGLPVLGVLLGTAMGADPLRVLLHTPVGWGLLAASAAFECLGLLWVRGIVRRATGGAHRTTAEEER